MEASCTFNHKDPPASSATAPVLFTCLENAIMLRHEGSGACAGMLISQALPRLVKDHSVTLTACLGAQVGPRLASSSSWKRPRSEIRVRLLRVIVYGYLATKNTIRSILDQNDLFLQRPEDSEYDRRVRYLNPMYFTRPGEEYPRLLNQSATPSQRPTTMTFDEAALEETKKIRVLRIFDESGAVDGDGSLSVKQSSRIISTLKESVIFYCTNTRGKSAHIPTS